MAQHSVAAAGADLLKFRKKNFCMENILITIIRENRVIKILLLLLLMIGFEFILK